MPTNPLKKAAEAGSAPRVTPQERCDELNAYLRGERPAEYGDHAGKYLYPPRTDVRWIVHNGRPTIESVAGRG